MYNMPLNACCYFVLIKKNEATLRKPYSFCMLQYRKKHKQDEQLAFIFTAIYETINLYHMYKMYVTDNNFAYFRVNAIVNNV